MRINHISIAARDIQKFAELYEVLFGIKFKPATLLEGQKVYLSFGETEGTGLELISPATDDSPVSKFLDKRGEGLHHVCFEVENLEQSLQSLKSKGVEIIGEPSEGGTGKKIVFLHPRSTGGVLIELKES
ncbi:MAG: methylmalonyl-CoA epimerase [candidate division Zixibacteria bacterium RBG_16_48_11]|nr:MAG: methylmalonyl-CoA epimerase [candidate division Zixibacteria bacterium RBG_16_48_11]